MTPYKRVKTPKEDVALLKPLWVICLDQMESFGKDRYSAALQLAQPWRTLYVTFKLDTEVRNGGFHQFFWNSEGRLDQAVNEALELIGATALHGIFKQAVACAVEFEVIQSKQRSENTWEDFTAGYKTIPWEGIDKAFYETSPTLLQCMANYVRSHAGDFNSYS